jgi:hypothetical protein
MGEGYTAIQRGGGLPVVGITLKFKNFEFDSNFPWFTTNFRKVCQKLDFSPK